MQDTNTNIIMDHSGSGLHFRRTQDVTNILDMNKQDYNQSNQHDSGVMGRKVASVPMVILEKWLEEGIDYRRLNSNPEMAKRFKAKLNDPEFRALRTHLGNL